MRNFFLQESSSFEVVYNLSGVIFKTPHTNVLDPKSTSLVSPLLHFPTGTTLRMLLLSQHKRKETRRELQASDTETGNEKVRE